ncbi:TrkA C-terminal domain-containing protein [Haloplanus rubicundus]|uniref:Potassium transporter TrkA n=1 Tax=Haloplanus rubicundus TaxID=1547898 RepID=A0A345EH67_9EURY|nr:TrkA C-terminal domain-containing protein [Haloplanus rubicundus]AXG11539.1 potassium transporter TrkA [Haloplanus rubicundus]
MPLQVSVPAVDPSVLRVLTQLLAFGVGAALVSAVAALGYRWYTKLRLPLWLSVLLGLSVVAVALNTVGVFTDLLVGETDIFSLERIVFNVLALGVGAAAAPVGRLVGDRVVTDVFAVTGAKELDVEVSRIVRSVGRITDVTLPQDVDDIEDMEGYDPVAPATKETLAGKTLIFPRRLTVAELEARLVTRLQDDYDVGHVDVELAPDGTVEYLALGSRATGIGPTLSPGTVAVAVRADPANAASPGDRVQVWRTDAAPERVLTAELRAHVDDVATLAVAEEEAARLDAASTYRLVTLPAEPQAEREFASLLRAAEETMYVVRVAEGSDLVGAAVEELAATVVAVTGADGSVDDLPDDRTLAAGDAVYVVARPETYRRLDARSRPPEA